MWKDSIPNPGSKQAIKKGCTCPIMDNEYGEGCGKSEEGYLLFWMVEDCPLHGIKGEH